VKGTFILKFNSQSDEEIIDNSNNYLATSNALTDNNHENLPEFFNKFGKIGVNYDLDVNDTEPALKNKPFIYCQVIYEIKTRYNFKIYLNY